MRYLNWKRVLMGLSLTIVLFTCRGQEAASQTTVPLPAFDVASIKLATEQSLNLSGPHIQTSANSLITRALPLRDCVRWAFNLPAEIVGPTWLDDIRVDIVAKTSAPVREAELFLMLQMLLIERMGMRTHFEKKNRPVYALLTAKGGPKFLLSTTEGPMTSSKTNGFLVIQRVSLDQFAAELSETLGERPILNSTGLKGLYDMRLDLGAIAAMNQNDRLDAANAIGAALRELGLTMVKAERLIDVLVIDRIDRAPSEN